METLKEFLLHPIVIRVICVLFVGAIGSNSIIKKIFMLFELFTRSKKAKEALFILTDIVSGIITILLSVIISFVFKDKGDADKYLWLTGSMYGLAAIGVYHFIIEGRLFKLIKAWRNK